MAWIEMIVCILAILNDSLSRSLFQVGDVDLKRKEKSEKDALYPNI